MTLRLRWLRWLFRLSVRLNRLTRGYSYVSPRGFSINEGEFPNIHLSWADPGNRGSRWHFYLAFSDRFRVTLPRRL